MLTYTNIQHQFRKSNNLSCTEYVFLDMVYHLHTKPFSKVQGWCYASKELLANEIGLTKRGILKMMEKLIDLGFLERDEKTKYLRTTEAWAMVYFEGEQSTPVVNKVHSGGEQSSPRVVNKVHQNGEQSSPYKYSKNNNNKKDKEADLCDLVEKPFKSSNFDSKWQEWLDYRKQRKLPKYVPSGLKKTFSHLAQLSGGNELVAIQIIEQSMANGWQGLFNLKNQPIKPANSQQKLTYQQEIELAKAKFRVIE